MYAGKFWTWLPILSKAKVTLQYRKYSNHPRCEITIYALFRTFTVRLLVPLNRSSIPTISVGGFNEMELQFLELTCETHSRRACCKGYFRSLLLPFKMNSYRNTQPKFQHPLSIKFIACRTQIGFALQVTCIAL